VAQETKFGEVTLERSDEIASNLSLGIKISGINASTEIVNIENALGQLQYRSLSAQQTKTEELIEYHSTLVRSTQ
jgi:hypothetical protein